MAGIVIPRQNILDCSFEVNEAVTTLVERGHDFRSDEAVIVAAGIAKKCVPNLRLLSSEDVRAESEAAIQWHQGEAPSFGSSSFQAVLGRVSLEQVNRVESIEGFDGHIDMTMYDLTLVFRQRVVESDPDDLAYSDEILIPMRDLVALRTA